MNHTAGPWTVGGMFAEDRGEIGLSIDAGETFVAVAITGNYCGAPDEATSKANAHVIAAAPELLAACEAALDELRCYEADIPEMEAPENVAALHEATAMVEAAIAKAKGTKT